MSEKNLQEKGSQGSDFEQQAGGQGVGFLHEMVDFIRHNKKWWLIPIVVTLLLFGALLVLGGTAAAPFIYTLF
jgi:hypothetical protein